MTESLIYEVLSAVAEIPAGKVASYRQIARLTGHDRNARLIGRILRIAEAYGDYPCHRVVSSCGRTAPGFREQPLLLQAEGITLKKNGCVDMKQHQWDA